MRWQYKLEPTQILKITIELEFRRTEEFLGRMNKDGRITIPKLIIDLFREEELDPTNQVFTITLTPLQNDQEELS